MSLIGAVVGCVTGVISGVMQIPYSSYILYKKMREDGYIWDSALLAAIGTGFMHTFELPVSCIHGIYTGWREGVKAAFTLPYTDFYQMKEFFIWKCTDNHFRLTDALELASLSFSFWSMRASDIERSNAEYKFNRYQFSKLLQNREQLIQSAQRIPDQINMDITTFAAKSLMLEYKINQYLLEHPFLLMPAVAQSGQFSLLLLTEIIQYLVRRNSTIQDLLADLIQTPEERGAEEVNFDAESNELSVPEESEEELEQKQNENMIDLNQYKKAIEADTNHMTREENTVIYNYLTATVRSIENVIVIDVAAILKYIKAKLFPAKVIIEEGTDTQTESRLHVPTPPVSPAVSQHVPPYRAHWAKFDFGNTRGETPAPTAAPRTTRECKMH